VCVVGLKRREGRIRNIGIGPEGERVVEVVLTNLKTAVKGADGMNGVAPKDAKWIGQQLTFTSASSTGIEEAKIRKLWARDVPGAWLTRSEAPRGSDDGGASDAA
jgi:hypothetical protein